MADFTNQSKNSTTPQNRAVSDVSDTWDELDADPEETWDEIEGTWDDQGTQYTDQEKHSTPTTLQTKN